MTHYYFMVQQIDKAELYGPFLSSKFDETLRTLQRYYKVLYAVSCRLKQ